MENSTGTAASQRNNGMGGILFNAADRLAIINVLNSYGYFIDELPMENFFGLFTDSATIEGWHGDKKLGEGQQFRDVTLSRREKFKREKIQRRHVLSAPRFDRQSDNSASGQVYLQLYKTQDGQTSLVTISCCKFTVVKQHGQWKIDRWIVRTDSKLD